MSKVSDKASWVGMVALALVSSVALAGGKPIGGGGGGKDGGGGSKGGGDTGTGISATLGVSGNQAVCNWSGKGLVSGDLAFCSGEVTATWQCADGKKTGIASFYDEEAPQTRKNGSGSATLVDVVPGVEGSGCLTLCTVEFKVFSAGIVGKNASVTPVADTTVTINSCL